MMRRFASISLLLLILAPSAQAQTRASDDSPTIATAMPILLVTMQNPRETNLGKAATFVVSVTNRGKGQATDVVVLTHEASLKVARA